MSNPIVNPNDPDLWVNSGGQAVQQTGAQVTQDLLNGTPLYPSANDALAGTNALQTSTVGQQALGAAGNSLLGALGISLPTIEGGARHLVMRAVEVVIGVVLVAAAVRSFSNGTQE